jgi:hypothetical protein
VPVSCAEFWKVILSAVVFSRTVLLTATEADDATVMLPTALMVTGPLIEDVVEGPIRAVADSDAVTDPAFVVVMPPLRTRLVPVTLMPAAVLVFSRPVKVVVSEPAFCRKF